MKELGEKNKAVNFLLNFLLLLKYYVRKREVPFYGKNINQFLCSGCERGNKYTPKRLF